MISDYLVHNLFWEYPERFAEGDPHLMQLRNLPFAHPLGLICPIYSFWVVAKGAAAMIAAVSIYTYILIAIVLDWPANLPPALECLSLTVGADFRARLCAWLDFRQF